jgi:hypothetical protein
VLAVWLQARGKFEAEKASLILEVGQARASIDVAHRDTARVESDLKEYRARAQVGLMH